MIEKPSQTHWVVVAALILLAMFMQLGVFKAPPSVLIFSVLGLIVFMAAFLKTNIALGILVISMLLSPEFGSSGGGGRAVVLRFDDVLMFMIFFGWMAKMAVRKDVGVMKKTSVNRPIFFYVFVCVFSSIVGVLLGTTEMAKSFFYNLKYIEYFMLYFIVLNNIENKKQVRTFLYLMLGTCLIVGIYALLFHSEGRATAPFEGKSGEPNTLAGYLVVMMGAALGMMIHSRSMRARLIYGGFFVFMIFPLVFTLSRTGWLGFITMYAAFIFFSKRYKGILIFTCVAMIAAAPILLPKKVHHRFERTFNTGRSYQVGDKDVQLDESAGARIRSWQDSVERWTRRPVLGTGVASGRVLYDMQYGRFLREVGLLGVLSFGWIVFELFRMCLKVYRLKDEDPMAMGLSLGFMCSLVGLLVMGIGAEIFIIIRIMEPFWFLAAMVMSFYLIDQESEETSVETPPVKLRRV